MNTSCLPLPKKRLSKQVDLLLTAYTSSVTPRLNKRQLQDSEYNEDKETKTDSFARQTKVFWSEGRET